jgi:Flp pilus assembly pilin Flp
MKVIGIQTERGQALGEFVLILMLIAIVAIVVLTLFGNQISNMLSSVANAL